MPLKYPVQATLKAFVNAYHPHALNVDVNFLTGLIGGMKPQKMPPQLLK